ncbi:MAG TPA: exo-alpha-sialidase [Candidatus Dormibacteraeota bacterium]|nr:exo-alpha-sialidase [Candidatus Dormibacteraeota bacterium]
MKSFLSVLAFTGVICAATAQTNSMRLLSAIKIWHGEKHNAFTDLIRFEGKWYCTFRESRAHVGGSGKIRVLASSDGDAWNSAALVAEDGIDLRDPKLSITPDNRLMLLMGGSVYEGKTLKERQPRVAFSKDATNWTAPEKILEKGDWLWRVTWHKGTAYGIAYYSVTNRTSKTQGNSAVKLVATEDGIKFRTVTPLQVDGSPNESTLRFLPSGDCVALVRRESGDKQAWIGTSSLPYKDWKWQPAGMQIGGPNFIVLSNDRMVASGRQYNGKLAENRTFVGDMTLHDVNADLIVPSGGDCSYSGMVWHAGILWVSYYSSHEGATDIYLAKVKVGSRN